MNRNTIVNSFIAIIIVVIIGVVFVVESREASVPTATTTTTTLPATTTSTTTTTTSTTTSTTTTTTTPPETTVPPTTDPPTPRDAWPVVVVNGSTAGERLAPTVQLLTDIGYVGVRGLVASVRTTETVIYYGEGGLSAAERLAADVGFAGLIPLAPLDEAPPVPGRNDAQLLLYIGGV